jgi:hypothetical protein
MSPGIKPRIAWLVCTVALIAGCASTSQASRSRDAEAKQFRSHPGSSSLYIYRPGAGRQEQDDSTLYIDGRLIGFTLPRSFFVVHLQPGDHDLYGIAGDNGRLRLETRPGELYFIGLTVEAGQSYFYRTDPQDARRAIRACCALLENWAGGQRPLLR